MDDAVVYSTERWRPCACATLFLMGLVFIVADTFLFPFAGRLWSYVIGGVILAFWLIFMCYLSTSRLEQVNGGVGLSQGDIEAIPAFEYRAAEADDTAGDDSGSSSVEACSVCISAMRNGETVRRLPACGHTFHARCINGWLLGHATCPICRAGVMVVTGDGEPPPVAAAV